MRIVWHWFFWGWDGKSSVWWNFSLLWRLLRCFSLCGQIFPAEKVGGGYSFTQGKHDGYMVYGKDDIYIYIEPPHLYCHFVDFFLPKVRWFRCSRLRPQLKLEEIFKVSPPCDDMFLGSRNRVKDHGCLVPPCLVEGMFSFTSGADEVP